MLRAWTPRILRAAPLLGAGLLLGCATATPYQPVTKGLGYAEQRLETTRYRISYTGNSATPREVVENYVMYRAAEVTLNNGYDWFLIADQVTRADPRKSGGGTSGGVGLGIGGGSGNFGTGISISLGKILSGGSEAYDAQMDILVSKGAKPADNARAFDARQLKANLEGQIQRAKAR